MKKSSAIVLINMILAIISCNAFAIDWDDCSNSLRHLEDDADHAKRTSEELKDMSFAIKSLKGELSRCNSAYMDCNAIKNKIDEMTQQFNKTEITHTNRVAGIVFSFANMQLNCDYNFNIINIFNNKYENMECFRLISFMQLYKIDKYNMNKACIEKKQQSELFCNKCFSIP